MSTTLNQNFEGGPAGSAIDTTNSAGGGDAFDNVTTGFTYDSTQPMKGNLCGLTAPTSVSIAGRYGVTSSKLKTRFYWKIDTASVVYPLRTTVTGDVTSIYIEYIAAGVFRLNASGIWTGTKTVPLNQSLRLELYTAVGTSATTGSVRFAWYLGDSTTAQEDTGMITGVDLSGGTGTLLNYRIGVTNSTYTGNSRFDNVTVVYGDDITTTLIGPSVSAPTLSLGLNDRQAQIVATTTSGTSPYTYAITQTAGTTTTPTADGTGKWLVAKHATDTLIYQVTVTDANSQSAIQSVSVPPYTSVTSAIQRPSGTIPGNTWA